jgi:hypothetical protein
MKSKKGKISKEREHTPIIDGDTRPDHQEDALMPEKRKTPDKTKEKKMTSERGADMDTLEDFKDAK